MFHGCIVPLVTPFTKENKIDVPAFLKLVEWYVAEGADCLVICGITAETPTLTQEEQLFLIESAVKTVKGRIPVVAGTGTCDTFATVEMTKKAKEKGVDGCMIVTPYLSRPTFEGCYRHFEEVAKVDLPMIFYYHPGRTACKLSSKMIAEIAQLRQIIAIKEGSGDIEAVVDLLQMTDKKVLSGDDCMTIPMMSMGGSGCISIIANVIPKEWKRMVANMALGDGKGARAIFKKYYRLAKALVLETNPQCLKYSLSVMGKCESNLRLPLIEPKESTKKEICEAMQEVGLISENASLL
jgi:4-hydroxy-tetrahydrodipicolinate synthase